MVPEKGGVASCAQGMAPNYRLLGAGGWRPIFSHTLSIKAVNSNSTPPASCCSPSEALVVLPAYSAEGLSDAKYTHTHTHTQRERERDRAMFVRTVGD